MTDEHEVGTLACRDKDRIDANSAEDRDSLAKLWESFKQSGSRSVRDKLIVAYSPLVKYVASKLASGLPHYVEREDLAEYGFIGLIDAIQRYDPARNVKFETYAIPRIRGAIIDALRAQDWVPRSVRSKAKDLEQAYSKLHMELGRVPTEQEVARELGITEGGFRAMLAEMPYSGVATLDQVVSTTGDGGGVTLGDTLEEKSAGPGAVYENREVMDTLATALQALAERERIVIGLYYFEGLTLAAIGEILGVTESRVCQMHTKAVLQLRGMLASRIL